MEKPNSDPIFKKIEELKKREPGYISPEKLELLRKLFPDLYSIKLESVSPDKAFIIKELRNIISRGFQTMFLSTNGFAGLIDLDDIINIMNPESKISDIKNVDKYYFLTKII